MNNESIPPALLTPKQAIFHSATLLGKIIIVEGTVILLEVERHRIDIANEGGKLILRLPENVSVFSSLKIDDYLKVKGILRKEQRRTFLQVQELLQG